MTNVSVSLSDWVESYTKDLYSWALHKVSNEELAKDLVQDTFLAAAEKLNSWKGESAPKTWLFSILNHKIIDYYRKKIRQPVSLENRPDTLFFDESGDWNASNRPGEWDEEGKNLLDDADFRNVLQTCLEALPERWNTCVKLKYLMNKNGEEICQELDIAPTNLWQMVHRAKLQLRDCIETNWFNH
ncbi:MAG: sigma-70 family RNA polymerase sigma factor [Bacteroidia bacterium]|nr:sigma-70 family RNA polymerase sigma factor [Bacteroidia bacterium]